MKPAMKSTYELIMESYVSVQGPQITSDLVQHQIKYQNVMSQITNLAHPGSEPKNFTRVVHVLTERQHPVTLEQKVVESFERVGIDNSLEIVSETFSFYKHLCNLATQQYIAGRANFNKIHESQIVSAHKNPTPLDIDALASNVTEHLNIEHLSEIGQLSLYTKVAGLSHFLILEGTIAI